MSFDDTLKWFKITKSLSFRFEVWIIALVAKTITGIWLLNEYKYLPEVVNENSKDCQ